MSTPFRISVTLIVLAVALVIGLGAVALLRDTAHAEASEPDEPTFVAQVPTSLPPEGVMVNPVADILLLPPSPDIESSVLPVSSPEEAIALALGSTIVAEEPSTSRAILAVVTIGATVPPPGDDDGDEKWDTVADRLCWVVTSTYAQPVLAVRGGPGMHVEDEPSAYKSHYNILIDAQSGDLVWGFFAE